MSLWKRIALGVAGSLGLRADQSRQGWRWVSASVVAVESFLVIAGFVLAHAPGHEVWWGLAGQTGLLLLADAVATYILLLVVSLLFDRPRRRMSFSGNALARWPGLLGIMAFLVLFSSSQSPAGAFLVQQSKTPIVLRSVVILWAYGGVVAFLLCVFFPMRLLRVGRVVRWQQERVKRARARSKLRRVGRVEVVHE